MRWLRWFTLATFAAGVALLGYSVAVGESAVHLVLVFPVVTGAGAIGLAGIGFVFLAMFLGFLSFAYPPSAPVAQTAAPATPGSPPGPVTRAPRFGGVVFLGPLPIVFGSSPKISKVMLVLAVVMTILLLAFFVLVLN